MEKVKKKRYLIKLTERHSSGLNDKPYIKGEVLEVVNVFEDSLSYFVYYDDTLDFVPKRISEIIKELN